MTKLHCTLAAVLALAAYLPAQLSWSAFYERREHAISSGAQQQLLAFGGRRGTELLGDTWVGENGGWTREPDSTVALQPLPREGHAMATLATGVVLFGGSDDVGEFGETWVWNGGWGSTGILTPSPSARRDHTIIFHAGRQSAILFGGRSGGYPLNDLWEWDGSQWSPWFPVGVSGSCAGIPCPRFDHAMAYNSQLEVMLLFGGSGNQNDTWELDPGLGVWTLRSPTTSPGGRREHTMVYDAANDRTLLFGGRNASQVLGDTWIWDGTDWTPHTGTNPAARTGHAMAYDPILDRVVLVGGKDANDQPLTDMWVWNNSDWERRTPSPRSAAVMAYDKKRVRAVLFGGVDGSSQVLGDTWEWDGFRWEPKNPPGQIPSPRLFAAMVYDEVNEHCVMFGGLTLAGDSDETWIWDGNVWTRSNTTRPPARSEHVMAYDAARNRTVMVGGRNGAFQYSDHWQWGGGNWNEVTAASLPSMFIPNNAGAAMAYDMSRDRIIMVGGTLGGTWEWDGTDWTKVLGAGQPANGPGPQIFLVAVYDEDRARVVVTGGRQRSTGILKDDVWEYDGATWNTRTFPETPAPRARHTGVYDAENGQIVLFGGVLNEAANLAIGDTWLHEPDDPAGFTTSGSGCGTPTEPTMSVPTGAGAWLGSVLQLQFTGVPDNGLGVLFLGAAPLGFPIPLSFIGLPMSCTLLTTPSLQVGLPGSTFGTTSFPIAIPSSPTTLIGAEFYTQALWIQLAPLDGWATKLATVRIGAL